MIISRAPKSFRWFYGVSLACVKNPAAKGYNLPEPDALIGATRGWLPETIDRWNAARPGRGVGGGRPRKHPEE